MKKSIYIIIAIILFSFIENKAQDSESNSLYFQIYSPSSTVTKQLNINDYIQNDFKLGWQWGGHNRMTEALKMNTNQAIFSV
jgi:hypothetical protein